MKKITLLALVSLCSITFAFSQGRFLKRIENNYTHNITEVVDENNVVIRIEGDYNLRSKKGVEKLFFGDFNAKVEYFFEPSFEGARGFRIYKDSVDRYTLEVKSITNFKDIHSALDTEFSIQGMTANEMSSFSKERKEEILKHNRAMGNKRRGEPIKRYQITTKSVPINDILVEKLYAKTVIAIDTYKPAVEVVSSLETERTFYEIGDGYEATFRTIVGDDIWALSIHQPIGDSEKLSDLFRQIITDVKANSFDESKYIKLLDN